MRRVIADIEKDITNMLNLIDSLGISTIMLVDEVQIFFQFDKTQVADALSWFRTADAIYSGR